MKDTKERINDIREILNSMVAVKEIELTDDSIVKLSTELDELINTYLSEQRSA
jgi:hypothetical protein